MKQYDAVVVGGGPAGITAALYLCRSGVSVALAESQSTGGQVLRTAHIENYPGYPKGIKGWELADALEAHLEGYALDRYAEQVSGIQVQTDGIHVSVGQESLGAKSVVLCSGASPRPLGLEEEARFVGRGVSYCALCDGSFFRDQVVAVVGGGDAALEEALYLSRIARKVYLIHRREGFRATGIYRDKVRASEAIEILPNTVVAEILGADHVEGLSLRHTATGETRRLDVDGLFVFIGYDPQNTFFPSGLACDSKGFVLTDNEMRTNLPGIFAAGDIRSKLCRQVITAAGDGATAATAAFAYLEQLDA